MVLLDERGDVWQMVDGFMRGRWKEEYIGVGRDGGGMKHRSFEVEHVWQVENGSLWRRYTGRRNELMGRLEEAPFSSSSSVTNNKFEISLGLDGSKKDVILFHGAFRGM